MTPSIHLDQIDDLAAKRAAGNQERVTFSAPEAKSSPEIVVHGLDSMAGDRCWSLIFVTYGRRSDLLPVNLGCLEH
ncbi:MAG: hypothetical protein AAF543_05050 [Pseudomonadota bacterium]